MYSDMRWFYTALVVGVFLILRILRKANEWIYIGKLGRATAHRLPPGDMGWPLIGNMLSFFKAFKYGDPDSFISSFAARSLLIRGCSDVPAVIFGRPTVLVTTSEASKQVLADERFGPGWPKSVSDILGKKGLNGVSPAEHKRLRRLIAAPIAGHEALSLSLDNIKDITASSFESLAKMERPVEFLTEMRKTTFRVIMNIIMGPSEIDEKSVDLLQKEYSLISKGFKSMAINLPGFPYHDALKARKKLLKKFEAIVKGRRVFSSESNQTNKRKDMLALMMEVSDDQGNKLIDEEITDLIIIYLLAGHESSALAVTWAVIFLEEHPKFFKKAKEEQEDIVNRRKCKDSGLKLSEIKQMNFLQKVIDETLRVVNISFALFRETKTDVEILGYTIPKGWRVLPWLRSVHLDPKNFANPKEFNPSRWEDNNNKSGAFIPFGAGPRFCPGAEIAKLEIFVFLHYFLLNYRLERVSPGSKVEYLPFTSPVDKCLARIRKLPPSE